MNQDNHEDCPKAQWLLPATCQLASKLAACVSPLIVDRALLHSNANVDIFSLFYFLYHFAIFKSSTSMLLRIRFLVQSFLAVFL